MSKLKTALYLDDQRTATTTIPGYEEWKIVRNYDQFVDYIKKNGIPDLISFDHDLAEEHMKDYFDQMLNMGCQFPKYESFKEKTGLDCARWLIEEYCQPNNLLLKTCSVHSHNPVGATNIQSYINGFKKHTDQPQDCFIMKHPFKIEE